MRKVGSQQRAKLKAEHRRREKSRAEMPPEESLPLWPEKVEGGRLVRQLERCVEQLRDENPHGNQELFFDDVFLAYLLAFFNPSLRSLRVIEDFSQTKQAQRHLSTPRICRSTLSDFNRLADPERLQPIIAELRGALNRKFAGQWPSDLYGLMKKVLAVDGTFFSAAADVAWAVGHRNQSATRHRARVDVQLDVQTWLPEVIAVPEPGEGEAHVASHQVKAGAIHIYDRNYGSFELLAAHYEDQGGTWSPQADFVLRAKKKHLTFAPIQERTLTPEQHQRQILVDHVGHLTGSPNKFSADLVVREVVLLADDGTEIRLLTNLLDVPVEVIAELYRHRWQIELFFRWLKCYAHFDHLTSHSRSGVLLNFYVVIVGVLLMYLHTGGRPSKYAFLLLGMVAQSGGDSLESILPILRERERQCERDRKSAAARRARKKAETK